MWKHQYLSWNDKTLKCEFKIYDEPSVFGINNGRISKLMIWRDGVFVVNYDRGMDFNHLGETLLLSIVDRLEGMS